MSENTRTYQTRIPADFDELLLRYASLMARVEHCLFADIAKGKSSNELKSSYLVRFGITARQFNAVRVKLEGKIDSIQTRNLQLIEQKKQQIQALEEKLPSIKDKKTLHAKKRRLGKLQAKLAQLEIARSQKRVSLCFGSRKLFRAGLHFEKNGYASREEWKQDWQNARSSEIFMLGSKDETGGNQTCTASLADDGSITLRIRLPDALVREQDEESSKYLIIRNLRFAYGHEPITAAIRSCKLRCDLSLLKDPGYKNHGQAITFRFKKDLKGWRVFASADIALPPSITRKDNGIIGVDINSDHLAAVETDRFGNPIQKYTFPLSLQNTTTHQARALIGDACKQIIAICVNTQKPLAIEALDFQKKKAQLREKSNGYARMLSAFAYQSILTHLKSRGASQGVQIHSVNPAYTSLIGRVNYTERYGLSIHHAAALSIGRRSLGLSEKMPQGRREIPDGKGCYVTLDLPVRNRSRHVWHQWGQLSRKFPAALTAHFRAVYNRSSSSRKAALEIEIPDLVGGIPAHESSVSLLC